jgi:hypothetical protein
MRRTDRSLTFAPLPVVWPPFFAQGLVDGLIVLDTLTP